MKDGWEQLPVTTIMKCFKTCGIFDGMFDAVPISNDDQTEHQTPQKPDEFDHWFADLLEVPWEEYLAFDDQLESETHPGHRWQCQQNTLKLTRMMLTLMRISVTI